MLFTFELEIKKTSGYSQGTYNTNVYGNTSLFLFTQKCSTALGKGRTHILPRALFECHLRPANAVHVKFISPFRSVSTLVVEPVSW